MPNSIQTHTRWKTTAHNENVLAETNPDLMLELTEKDVHPLTVTPFHTFRKFT